MDCLFCKIAAKTIPSNVLYEDEHVMAFKDIRPQAPVHALIIPKIHIATIQELTPAQAPLAGQLLTCANQLAKQLDIAESGYRCVFNCNPDGGQEVYHIHLHLLGGRRLTWPPG